MSNMGDLIIIVEEQFKKFSKNKLDDIISSYNIDGEMYYKGIALESYYEGFAKGVDAAIEILKKERKDK